MTSTSVSTNSVTTLVKKACATCHRHGAVLICDGCQQSFCGKHVIDHRLDLTKQWADLTEECHRLQQDTDRIPSNEDPLLQRIDQWENESIRQVQQAAEAARTSLELLRYESSQRVRTALTEISTTLETSREAEDFSEIDLDYWRKQLQQLKTEMITPANVKIVNDQCPPKSLLSLSTTDTTPVKRRRKRRSKIHYDSSEQFFELLGPGEISDQGLLVTHVGPSTEYAYVRGKLLYSNNCFGIRLRLEHFQKPYQIFLGFTSIQSSMGEVVSKSGATIGWTGFNQVFQHGRYNNNVRQHRYHSGKIRPKDVMNLILDCGKHQIRLVNERTKMTNVLNVKKKFVPPYYQFLVVLSHPGDSVRILSH